MRKTWLSLLMGMVLISPVLAEGEASTEKSTEKSLDKKNQRFKSRG